MSSRYQYNRARALAQLAREFPVRYRELLIEYAGLPPDDRRSQQDRREAALDDVRKYDRAHKRQR